MEKMESSQKIKKEFLQPPGGGAFLLAFIILLAYLPVLNAGYVWDDNITITDNSLLHSAHGLLRIWTDPASSPMKVYWPLTYSTYWVEYHLWGNAPLGYHLVNILLHILNTLLLWQILKRLSIPGSWIIAAIFGLHPVNVESVAWVTERKNVLCGFFYLLALLAWLKSQHHKNYYILSLLLFVSALLSKSLAMSLPFTLVLLLWWKKDKLTKQDIIPIIPYFLISFVITGGFLWLYHTNEHIATPFTLFQRILMGIHCIWFYIWKLLLPINLTIIYPSWNPDIHLISEYIYPLLTIFLLVSCWIFRNKWGKGPFIAICFYIITLGPVLHLIDQPAFTVISFVNDHAQYLACIGFIALMVSLANTVIKHPAFARILTYGVLLVFGSLTWFQSSYYQDMETLFQQNLRKNTKSWIAHYNVGVELEKQRKTDEAAEHYNLALQLHPSHIEAHNNLGRILEQQGKPMEAITHFNLAIKTNSQFFEAYNNLGIAYTNLNNYDLAIANYNKAIELNPNFALAYNNLGLAYAHQGKLKDAVDCFKKALQINSEYDDAKTNLNVTLAVQISNPHK